MGWEIYSGRGGNQHRRFVPDKDLPPEAQSVLAEPDWEAKYHAAEATVTALRERLEEIARISGWEERDRENFIAQGPMILIQALRQIHALAKGPSQ